MEQGGVKGRGPQSLTTTRPSYLTPWRTSPHSSWSIAFLCSGKRNYCYTDPIGGSN